MNRIRAVVTDIRRIDNVTIVSFDADGYAMRMMGLGFNVAAGVGDRVTLGIKATNIALARAFAGEISISNRLNAVIEEVHNGELLSSIMLRVGETPLECITTLDASREMGLEEGDEVTALIKASELSILDIDKEVS